MHVAELEAILKKEGNPSASRLLEQYNGNFAGRNEVSCVEAKAGKTRDYMRKYGLEALLPAMNKAFPNANFDALDFECAELVETLEKVRYFKQDYGTICPTVSVKFPREMWGNGLWGMLKSAFRKRKTILQKAGMLQMPGFMQHYGIYFGGSKFNDDGNIFLNSTGLCMLEDGESVDRYWEHEALHAAYREHSKVSWYNIDRLQPGNLGIREKEKIASAIIDMYLIDEISARRGSWDMSCLKPMQSMMITTVQYYIGMAIGRYNSYAGQNGIAQIRSTEELVDMVKKKEEELADAVDIVESLEPKLTKQQLTQVLYTCSPTKDELASGQCHSPFDDIKSWNEILKKYRV